MNPAPALLDRYDGLLLDLDGTAFRGATALPGAVDAVRQASASGRAVCFVTNNASRSAAEVAANLTRLGFDADPRHVMTSAEAGAALLAERLPAGEAVLVVGTEALADEVRAAGLTPVRTADGRPSAVVQGHSPHTCWSDLAQACLALRAGALWVACNVDPTLPTERGELPGNGAMVAALRAATGRQPEVAGKPGRRLLDQATQRIGARRPLVVGDWLDTDIAGARAAGLASLLVLTGVTDAAALLAAPRGLRPAFVAADLTGLHEPAERSRVGPRPPWQVAIAEGRAKLASGEGAGAGTGDPVDALRALCAAWWPIGEGPLEVHAADEAAHGALAVLGLTRADRVIP
jgi:glycerol-1-phosphatase